MSFMNIIIIIYSIYNLLLHIYIYRRITESYSVHHIKMVIENGRLNRYFDLAYETY